MSRTGDKRPGKGSSPGVVKRALSSFLPASVFVAVILAAIFHYSTLSLVTEVERRLQQQLETKKADLERDMGWIIQDLLFLLLVAEQDEAFLGPYRGAPTRLAREFIALSKSRGIYDQLRVIDDSGLETLRVELRDGVANLVPLDELQDKSGRYYYRRAMALDHGEAYASPLDLNVEHGEVERPFKPMIRLATPLFDAEGNKRAILVVNYLAAALLETFEKGRQSASHPALLNSSGYWLHSADEKKRWGFMFDHGKEITFGSAYPTEWQRISAEASGGFCTARGMFRFTTVQPFGDATTPSPSNRRALQLVDVPGGWKLVTFIPQAVLTGQRDQRLRVFFFAFAALLILLATGSWVQAQIRILREQSEQARRKSETRYRSLTENLPVGLCRHLLDSKGGLVMTNPALVQMLGYASSAEFLCLSMEELHVDRSEWQTSVDRLMGHEGISASECQLKTKSGSSIWVAVSAKTSPDRSGQWLLADSVIEDITERKRLEDELHQSLGEKETLLRELHHRVKNNLQIISSLLSLRNRQAQKKCESCPQLIDASTSVRAIALVHRDLLQSTHLKGHVDFGRYVRELIAEIEHAYGINRNLISVRIQADSIPLDAGQAVSCGLILTELVSNSLKHAFTPGSKGEIHVTCRRNSQGKLHLTVRDNGVGMPSDFDLVTPRTIGMQLVTSLAQHLKAELRLHRGDIGTQFDVLIPS